MQHADELLQVTKSDFLRREPLLESIFDLLQTDMPVQHVQDVVLFIVKTKVLQAHRFLDNPITRALLQGRPFGSCSKIWHE